MIQKLHEIKDEMNQIIRQLNNVDDLIIDIDIVEVKVEGRPAVIHGLEIMILKEIY
jgi:hypothetical protein